MTERRVFSPRSSGSLPRGGRPPSRETEGAGAGEVGQQSMIPLYPIILPCLGLEQERTVKESLCMIYLFYINV